MTQPQLIQINVTLPETNQILDALGALPFRDVYQLVNKVQQQAEAQLQPSSPTPPSPSIPEPITETLTQNNGHSEVSSGNSSGQK